MGTTMSMPLVTLDQCLVFAHGSFGPKCVAAHLPVLQSHRAITSDDDDAPTPGYDKLLHHTSLLLLTTTPNRQETIGGNIASVYGDVENVNINGLTSKDLQLRLVEYYVHTSTSR